MSQWGEGQTALVRVLVDFPGAEGVYVVHVPVYYNDRLTEKIKDAAEWAIDNLARDAGVLAAEKRAD